MPYLLVLLITMPIIEIAILLRVGEAAGWISTLLFVIATALLGSALLRQQGLATLNRARQRMDSGEMPAQQLVEGLFIMIGGVLLLTPGFVTDAFGFLCVIPLSRQWLARKLSVRGIAIFSQGTVNSTMNGSTGGASESGHDARKKQSKGAAGEVIDGDFTRLEDD